MLKPAQWWTSLPDPSSRPNPKITKPRPSRSVELDETWHFQHAGRGGGAKYLHRFDMHCSINDGQKTAQNCGSMAILYPFRPVHTVLETTALFPFHGRNGFTGALAVVGHKSPRSRLNRSGNLLSVRHSGKCSAPHRDWHERSSRVGRRRCRIRLQNIKCALAKREAPHLIWHPTRISVLDIGAIAEAPDVLLDGVRECLVRIGVAKRVLRIDNAALNDVALDSTASQVQTEDDVESAGTTAGFS
jgi:hypothetical protein